MDYSFIYVPEAFNLFYHVLIAYIDMDVYT